MKKVICMLVILFVANPVFAMIPKKLIDEKILLNQHLQKLQNDMNAILKRLIEIEGIEKYLKENDGKTIISPVPVNPR